jgi:hypothetical protein
LSRPPLLPPRDEVSVPNTSPQSTLPPAGKPKRGSIGTPVTRSAISTKPGSPVRVSPSATRTARAAAGLAGVRSKPAPVSRTLRVMTFDEPRFDEPKPIVEPG